MKHKLRVLVLKADGINCDEETVFAFNLAGADAKLVHVNDLRTKQDSLSNYQIMVIPGGFAYGDDVVSGKILAVELSSFFYDEIKKFLERKNTLIMGICNGFQVLVRTGLLPFNKLGTMDVTLTNNDSGHFECRWVDLKIEQDSKCMFLNKIVYPEDNRRVIYQVAHGEGKLFSDKKTIDRLEKEKLVVFRYVDKNGNRTQEYPSNPNGSLNAIAGICDPSGRILGIMPHPERFVKIEQHPNWRREKLVPQGLPIFQSAVKYIVDS